MPNKTGHWQNISKVMGVMLTSHKAPIGRSEDSITPIDLLIQATVFRNATEGYIPANKSTHQSHPRPTTQCVHSNARTAPQPDSR